MHNFDSVLQESSEYLDVLSAQPTHEVDWSDRNSCAAYYDKALQTFKNGNSQLDLILIYETYYDQWKRGLINLN